MICQKSLYDRLSLRLFRMDEEIIGSLRQARIKLCDSYITRQLLEVLIGGL